MTTSKMHTWRMLAVGVLICASLGASAGVAVGQSASSDWDRFASWDWAGVNRCAAQKASVTTNTPPNAFETGGVGSVRYRSGNPCDVSSVPAGDLGLRMFIARGDGTVCGVREWSFSQTAGGLYEAGTGNYLCGSFSSMQAYAKGKVYRSHYQNWIEAAYYVGSPVIN